MDGLAVGPFAWLEGLTETARGICWFLDVRRGQASRTLVPAGLNHLAGTTFMWSKGAKVPEKLGSMSLELSDPAPAGPKRSVFLKTPRSRNESAAVIEGWLGRGSSPSSVGG
jgi:hypothetical protein